MRAWGSSSHRRARNRGGGADVVGFLPREGSGTRYLPFQKKNSNYLSLSLSLSLSLVFGSLSWCLTRFPSGRSFQIHYSSEIKSVTRASANPPTPFRPPTKSMANEKVHATAPPWEISEDCPRALDFKRRAARILARYDCSLNSRWIIGGVSSRLSKTGRLKEKGRWGRGPREKFVTNWNDGCSRFL